MNHDALKKLEELVYQITRSTNKASAQAPLRELRAIQFREGSSLEPYARTKLGELISYAEKASGQVQEKAHWISTADSAFDQFKMVVRRDRVDE